MAKVSSIVKTPLIPDHQGFDGETIPSQRGIWRGGDVIEEAKLQLWLAGPLIAVSLLQYSLQVTSVMFVGHLGELALSSASMASSFASVTGFSVLLGMGSALETLCGQAYGAKQYHMLGVHMQRAMLTLFAVSIPLAVIWFYTSTILMALGQDHEISAEAGAFNHWMIPSLFAYSLLQCLNRFLHTQNNVFPMMIGSGVTESQLFFTLWSVGHFVYWETKARLISISNWVNVVLLACYVQFSSTSLNDIVSFVKLAISSAIMICFEYWSFEMVVLLSGLFPNPKLETSMVYMISVGLGSAISTKVSNELGAGRPQGTQLALRVMTAMALLEGAGITTATVLVHFVWGKLYSNENEVIVYVARMMPLLAVSDFLDGFQCVLSGAARGCGWQNLCVVINLGAYYVVGIPTAVLFAFFLHIGGMGLWMGIICGLLVQVTALVAVNLCTDWHEEVSLFILLFRATKAANSVQSTILAIDKAT
ncbi:MATE efflux family protein 5-like [Pyrus ussuriensis x Pyrus communis]|uniref:Protein DETOXIFICATION n=1 Tax=Pyrus ussuriensis x Pyrus communis TaxID=2448454 RepID=A0A5N5GWW6_9ROSA|nr:MATE efflux family protein 5-like [Pyrus ussuriensis x Pyrus communis]